MIALGIMGLVHGDFAAIWQGVPGNLPARPVLAYLCAFAGVASGFGLLWRRTAATAARVLFVYLLLWLLLFKLRFIIPQPIVEGSYQSCGENAVIVAGRGCSMPGSLSAGIGGDPFCGRRQGRAHGEGALRPGLDRIRPVPFRLSRFDRAVGAEFVAGHTFWAYFTGCTYLAAGVAVLVNVFARPAAALSAVQIGLFTLLVWMPIVAAGHASAGQMAEFVVSWTLTAGAWVVADSFAARLVSSRTTLAVRRRRRPPQK